MCKIHFHKVKVNVFVKRSGLCLSHIITYLSYCWIDVIITSTFMFKSHLNAQLGELSLPQFESNYNTAQVIPTLSKREDTIKVNKDNGIVTVFFCVWAPIKSL